MLDGLRLVYKMRYNMDLKEEPKTVETKQMTDCLKSTFTNLTLNGKNEFKIQVNQGFPEKLTFQSKLLKRIINNILLNSFNSTIRGKVSINFSK